MHGVSDGPTERRALDTMSLRKMYVNTALLKKTCSKCNKTFPRNSEYFYKRSFVSAIGTVSYESFCIGCDNERTKKWKETNKERKSYDEFYDCWVEQQKTYGRKCPYLNIEMTRKRGVQSTNGKKNKTCPTNISKDRNDSKRPYSKNNLMFVCWKVNCMKGNLTPLVAKRFLGFYKERFSNE